MQRTHSLAYLAVLVVLAVALFGCGGSNAPSSNSTNPAQPTRVILTGATSASPTPRAAVATRPSEVNGFQTVALDELPPQALETIKLIQSDGPFPYRQDGQVFQNRERILPRKSSGYYHEYTVETPGENDRGARRIVTGDEGEYYYTDDHYESFRIILMP